MLVLSRRVGDEIVFPRLGVRVRLLKLKGSVAAFGVEAPRDVTVLRGELAPFEPAHAVLCTPRIVDATARPGVGFLGGAGPYDIGAECVIDGGVAPA